MILVDSLSKRYGRRPAVDRLSFAVRAGQVCALLGPNGAGKTSTMRVLVGLSTPSEGRVAVLGEPVRLGAPVLGRVGVLIDGPAFVPHLSGLANLRLLWAATRRAWPPPALDDAIELAGLGAALQQKMKRYSMGMKQRLMLAQAIMRAPEVLVLDEPANGLDPAEVRALRGYLAGFAARGAAVLVSSHQLAEVQQVATHAVVMDRGRLVAEGPLDTLLGAADTLRFEADPLDRAVAVLRAVPGVTAVTPRDGEAEVTAPGVPSSDLVQALVTAGVRVGAVHRAGRSLEDAFLAMTESAPSPEDSDAAR
jgi:ABC-type multidrug transport system ATPase subunit